MHATRIEKEQGHWLLAKMGKKVLRPGGRELTEKLIRELQVCPQDDVVEFAPGLGFTADIAIGQNPKTYTGIELDEEATQLLRKKITGGTRQIIIGNASAVPPAGWLRK